MSAEAMPDDWTEVDLWAEIYRLRAALKGPDGHASWQDAATDERIRRVRAESALARRADEPVAWVALLSVMLAQDLAEAKRLAGEALDKPRAAAPAAPAYVPLSDREIAGLMQDVDDPLLWGRLGEGQGDIVRQFARAIERAVRSTTCTKT